MNKEILRTLKHATKENLARAESRLATLRGSPEVIYVVRQQVVDKTFAVKRGDPDYEMHRTAQIDSLEEERYVLACNLRAVLT